MIIVTIDWFINYGCGASVITRTKEWMQEYMLAMQPQKNLQCTPKGWQQIQKYFAGRKSWAMQGKGTFPFVQITL